MSTKQKFEKAISPRGVAVYPWLNKPDTKWKPEGEFKTSLRISGPDAEAFKESIEERVKRALENTTKELMESAKGDGKKLGAAKRTISELQTQLPFKPAYDDDGNEIPGEYEVSFKTKATIIDRKTGATIEKKLPIFDAKRQPMTDLVYGGSEIKVAFEYMPYFNQATKSVGVSLRMNAVQVLSLSTGGGANASGFGFEEEDGFVAEPKQQQEKDSNNAFTDEELEEDF